MGQPPPSLHRGQIPLIMIISALIVAALALWLLNMQHIFPGTLQSMLPVALTILIILIVLLLAALLIPDLTRVLRQMGVWGPANVSWILVIILVVIILIVVI